MNRKAHLLIAVMGIFTLLFSIYRFATSVFFGIPSAIHGLSEALEIDNYVFTVYSFAFCVLLILNTVMLLVSTLGIISFVFRLEYRWYIVQIILLVIYLLLWIIWKREFYILIEAIYVLAGILLANYWMKEPAHKDDFFSSERVLPYIKEFSIYKNGNVSQ